MRLGGKYDKGKKVYSINIIYFPMGKIISIMESRRLRVYTLITLLKPLSMRLTP